MTDWKAVWLTASELDRMQAEAAYGAVTPGAMTVTYTNDDDGIWLECPSCDWAGNFGFTPTVDQLLEAVRTHWLERHQ